MFNWIKQRLSGRDFAATSANRLSKELIRIQRSLPPFSTRVGLVDDSNLYEWTATILGPPGSPYEGGTFELRMSFTEKYPDDPPLVRFVTNVYHCNVDPAGIFCKSGMVKDWSPASTIDCLLTSILTMETDPEYSMQADIARLYLTNRAEHDRLARQYTDMFARPRD